MKGRPVRALSQTSLVPQVAGTEIAVPATLATGGNHPRTYMAFGDSISWGDGSNDGSGYRSYLEANLATYWGGSHGVPNEGVPGTRSNKGESRIGTSLRRVRPAARRQLRRPERARGNRSGAP